jgi:hypothetical protein
VYFMERVEEDAIGDLVTGLVPVKDDGLKAEAVMAVRARIVNFIVDSESCCRRRRFTNYEVDGLVAS